MVNEIPANVQQIIDEITSTASGENELANQYKINEITTQEALERAKLNIEMTGTTVVTDGYIKIHDDSGLVAELTPLNEMRVSNTHRLCGGLFNTSGLDTNIYTPYTSPGSSVAVASQVATLATGTNSSAIVTLQSSIAGQYTASNANFYRGVIRIPDVGTVGNYRQWGAFDSGNGFVFEIGDTTLSVKYYKETVATRIVQSQWNGDKTFILDGNFHVYEIYYKTSGVYFVIDGKLVHTIYVGASSIISNYNLKTYLYNYNSSSTNNIYLQALLNTINRFGDLITNPFYKNIVGAGTYNLKLSVGRLHSIICNNAAQTAGQSITIYDNTAASGNKIGTLDLAKLPSPMAIQYNTNGLVFSSGLTIVVVGAAVDITVIYE